MIILTCTLKKPPTFFCLLLLSISNVNAACAQQSKTIPPTQSSASPSKPLPPPGPPAPPKTKPNPSALSAGVLYERLLQQVKSGDLRVDFGQLRMAYATSDKLISYDINKDEHTKAFRALGEGNYEESLRLAEGILSKDYLDIYAHFAVSVASENLKNASKQQFHASVARELVKSILASGDGKAADTALHVISQSEMSVVLETLNLKPENQN